MKIEKRNNHKKKIIIGGMLATTVLIVGIFATSHSKYRVTESIKLGEGTINYSGADLNLVAIYLEDGTSNIYNKSPDDRIPTSGYTLNNEKSKCEINGEKDTDIEINYNNGKVSFGGVTKSGTKCYLYFQTERDYENPKITNIETINKTTSSFRIIVTATDNLGIASYQIKNKESGNYSEPQEINYFDFNNLTDGTTYNYVIKVCDTQNNCVEQDYSVTTIAIDREKPVINNVTTSAKTKNSITISVNASDNVGVTEYYYKKSTDSSFSPKQTTNSYTFNNLTPGTNYTFNIKVCDSANNCSETNHNEITELDTATITYANGDKNKNALYSLNNTNWTTITSGTTWQIPIGAKIKGATSGNDFGEIYFCSTTNCTESTSQTGYLGKASGSTTYTIKGTEKSYYYNWACFTEETLVTVYDEKKKKKLKRKIKDIKVGDKIYTYNMKQEKMVLTTVKRVEKVSAKEIYALKLKGGETLRCSDKHALYVAGVGYMMANEMKVGLKIMGMDGINYEIEAINIEHYPNKITLYNLYLEDGNNFFVGSLKVMTYAMVFVEASTFKTTKIAAGMTGT